MKPQKLIGRETIMIQTKHFIIKKTDIDDIIVIIS